MLPGRKFPKTRFRVMWLTLSICILFLVGLLASDQFWQVPILVIFVFKWFLLKDLDLLFRNACFFWIKHATNIVKTVNILLLMAQFHNGLSHFVNLASGETGIVYRSP